MRKKDRERLRVDAVARHTGRHRLNVRQELPRGGPLTEEDLVDGFYGSYVWRRWKLFMRWRDLPDIVRMYVGGFSVFVDRGPYEFELVAQRVLRTLRSENSKKGQPKRRRTLLTKKQGTFDF
jgi:hypothetical protein